MSKWTNFLVTILFLSGIMNQLQGSLYYYWVIIKKIFEWCLPNTFLQGWIKFIFLHFQI